MKFIFIMIISFSALGQVNHVPLSEAQRYIEAGGESVAGIYECKDRPSEPCLNFSECTSWETCEIAEVAGQFFLKDSESKKAAMAIKEKEKEDLKLAAKKDRDDAKNELKDLLKDASKVKTVAELKEVVLKIIKVLED